MVVSLVTENSAVLYALEGPYPVRRLVFDSRMDMFKPSFGRWTVISDFKQYSLYKW